LLAMDLEAYAHKIGYVCIFSNTTNEAAAGLHRLITTGTCGFDEGVPFWRDTLKEILAGHLNSLNWAGAKFSEPEWRVILETVRGRF
jgi:hypothetical protein